MLLFFWVLLLVILPSFYFKPTFEGFEYPKFIFSFSIFLISSLIILIRTFRGKTHQVKIKFYRADLLIWSFLVIYISSLFFSISLYTSLLSGWGPPQGGLFFLLICLGFYFYLRNLNFQLTHLIQISWLIILGVLLSLIIGLIKEFSFLELGVRIHGTQKNPIFYSSYLMLGLPCALSLLMITKNNIAKLLLTVISGVISLGLILSLTRSVWISTVISLIIFFVLLVRYKSINFKSLSTNRYLISLLMVVVLGITLTLPLIKSRLTDAIDISNPVNSLALRFYEASSAVAIIKDYPLLGVGPEALDHIYPRYRSVELNKSDREWFLGTPQIRNYYLHLATTLGILGVLVFILIIINFIWQFLSQLKLFPKDERPLLFGLLTSWLMIVIHYLFYGASITSQIFFWSLLAVLSSKLVSQTKNHPIFSTVFKNRLPGGLIFLGILIILLQVSLIVDFYSNYLFTAHFLTKVISEKISYLQGAININPYRPQYYRFLVDSNIVWSREILARPEVDLGQVSDLLNQSQTELNEGLLLDPTDPELFHLQADISFFKFRAAKRRSSNFQVEFTQAVADIKFSQSQDPTNPTLQDLETQLYLESGNLDLAIQSAQKTLTLKFNYAPALYHMGEAYKQLGDFDLAIHSYQETLKFNPNDNFAKAEIKKIDSQVKIPLR